MDWIEIERKIGRLAHQYYANGQVSSVQKPEGPTPQPSISKLKGKWKNGIFQNILHDRSFITLFDNTGDGHSKLKVPKLFNADVDSIL